MCVWGGGGSLQGGQVGVQCICGHLEDWAAASLIIAQYKEQNKTLQSSDIKHSIKPSGGNN